MNIQGWRKLGEALERTATWWRPDSVVLRDAARRDYDRYQICGECKGTGDIEVQDTGHFPWTCPSCGGSGLLPRQARLEAEIVAAAQPYYDRLTTKDAIQIAKERIEEWNYNADPHGYCHDRSVLLRLTEAAVRAFDKPPCDGSVNCQAETHIHGCYMDRAVRAFDKETE
jgi:hypothetical protein